MRKSLPLLLIVVMASAFSGQSKNEIFKYYNPGGKLTFNASDGDKLWHKTFPGKDGKSRGCTSCHGKDLTQPGKHRKTGKKIDPMSLKVNKKRLTDIKKIEKWFKRNCKWTFGRECTVQEKGNILEFLFKS